MTKIIPLNFINLVTPKAQAKHELLFNEPASGKSRSLNYFECLFELWFAEPVQIGSWLDPLEQCSDYFSGRQRVIKKDPTVWLDGAGPPQISLIISLMK